jgi:hypothetical protein
MNLEPRCVSPITCPDRFEKAAESTANALEAVLILENFAFDMGSKVEAAGPCCRLLAPR